jgi:hypothetical protein
MTLPFERACVFMSETMFPICGFFQYGGLIKLIIKGKLKYFLVWSPLALKFSHGENGSVHRRTRAS